MKWDFYWEGAVIGQVYFAIALALSVLLIVALRDRRK